MSLDTRKHPLILLVLFLINVIMNLRWIPSHCFICQNAITPAWTIDFLCPLCCEQLPWNSIACARCATPLPTSLSHCAYCLNKPVLQHNSLILFNYISPISDWIHAAKFQASFIHCKLLGQLLLYYLQQKRALSLPHCVIPMPLHKKRLRQRGYNQMIEIATPVCHALKLSMEKVALQRYRYHVPQSKLTLKDRQFNVKNSFRLQHSLTYSRFALLDDVTTSGNTLIAASEALLAHSDIYLEYWCIAKPF